jgi:hypothetical protein
MRPVGTALFLDFELLDEWSEMRGDRTREGVVLVLQAPSNCRQTNPSRMPVAFRGRRTLKRRDCSSTNVRHEQPIGHALLEML